MVVICGHSVTGAMSDIAGYFFSNRFTYGQIHVYLLVRPNSHNFVSHLEPCYITLIL
jgi:hypothetical protein